MRDNNSAFDHPIFNTKPMLRVRAIAAYDCVCAYCCEEGNEHRGPDGKPWHLDRIIPGYLGGDYVADNVALSCCACNCAKRNKVEDPDERPPSLERVEFDLDVFREWDRTEQNKFSKNRRQREKYSHVANDNAAEAGP
jgi:hypothetical protein